MTPASVAWHAGIATDPGLRRPTNEDRLLVDDARGIFMVADGLGGHAAGELAAETAVRVIQNRLALPDYAEEAAIRAAITQANNEIFLAAQQNLDLRGMACVLTLVVAGQDHILVGHVGDSRLYLVWNGTLRKLTSDHSPVGLLEDSGELTEDQAMRHPRRNEVFRDVGSQMREPDDPEFIDVRSLPFRPDAALLVCSDGLTDVLKSSEISTIISRYRGDPGRAAQELVEAANAAGGKDNVSVILLPGPEFAAQEAHVIHETRERHSATRPRYTADAGKRLVTVLGCLLAGAALSFVGTAIWNARAPRMDPPHSPRTLRVSTADARGILNAMAAASTGDTVQVPAGEYLGPLELKSHVAIVADAPRSVIVRSDPSSTTDPGVAIAARNVRGARVDGLRILADDTHPLRTGILIANSNVEVDDVEISGAIEAGMRFEGKSGGRLLGNYLHGNSGPGILIDSESAPRLSGNRVSETGADAVVYRGFEKAR